MVVQILSLINAGGFFTQSCLVPLRTTTPFPHRLCICRSRDSQHRHLGCLKMMSPSFFTSRKTGSIQPSICIYCVNFPIKTA